jgi:pyruvate dehydrogenase E2 component (dihydrolipoamide acetyltransferase)
MATRIIMPAGGQTTDEVVLRHWHKQVGDAVVQGDILFDVETDKAVLEIESCASGVLLTRYYEEGASVPAKALVAWVGAAGEAVPAADAPPAPAPAAASAEDEYRPILVKPDAAVEPPARGKVTASPAARVLAREHAVPLTAVVARGATLPLKRAAVAAFIAQDNTVDAIEIPVTKMRRTIAQRLLESVTTIPVFTAEIEVEMGRAMDVRKTLGSVSKVSFNDLIMSAVCRAITDYPVINSSWRGDTIRQYRKVNFGLAVSLPQGLVVPVVRDAGNRSLFELAVANANNIEQAKSGKNIGELISGGTITLSNLGGFGVKRFTAIINPPEACILAVGAIRADRQMSITGSFDHRIIDGAAGAGFLHKLKSYLEAPELLLLQGK